MYLVGRGCESSMILVAVAVVLEVVVLSRRRDD